MQRLCNPAQFKAVLDAGTVARTAHFALHRLSLPLASASGDAAGPEIQALFVVRSLKTASIAAPASTTSPAVPNPNWLGAVVPKRWAKRAVTRNAIKRQIYSVTHAQAPRHPHAAYVVRLRTGFVTALFPSAQSDALKALVRAELQQLWAAAAIASRPQGVA